ncbi:MAG: M48 family metalloprotease [Candidatus Omnitrophica bacterium]|nr:M48 family metalloprotease [Candidatus Omnitrophota bacterium]
MHLRDYRFIITAVFLFLGCASTGPSIDNQELKRLNEDLKTRAVELKIERSIYVNDIGFKLFKDLPFQEKKSYAYLGILAAPLDNYLASIFDKEADEDRVIIYGLVKDSAAEDAGLKAADIIFTIDGRKATVYNYDSLLKSLKPEQLCRIEVEREAGTKDFYIYPQRVPYYINFLVVESADVNAAAFSGGVAVTYGLLNFIDNDDELGIALGHELAHLIRGHILKSQGIDLVFSALVFALGKNVDIPQSGDMGQVLGSAFSASFSRDFEREADFLGTLLAYKSGFDIRKGTYIWERFAVELPKSLDTNFLSTHPTSSERLLRIRTIVDQIESGEIKIEDYLY